MTNNNEKVLIKGNYAIAQAAVNAGCQCYFGYPITPQTEIGEYLSGKMQELGRAYVCAESELGAINMVMGAVATGVKAMTSSSSCAALNMADGILSPLALSRPPPSRWRLSSSRTRPSPCALSPPRRQASSRMRHTRGGSGSGSSGFPARS